MTLFRVYLRTVRALLRLYRDERYLQDRLAALAAQGEEDSLDHAAYFELRRSVQSEQAGLAYMIDTVFGRAVGNRLGGIAWEFRDKGATQ